MKKTLLTGIAALLLATGAAHAGAEQSKIVLLCNGISRFPPERGLKPERFNNLQITVDLEIGQVLFDHYEIFAAYGLHINSIDSNEINFGREDEVVKAIAPHSDYITGSINRITGRGGVLFGNYTKPFAEGWELACRTAKPLF